MENSACYCDCIFCVEGEHILCITDCHSVEELDMEDMDWEF